MAKSISLAKQSREMIAQGSPALPLHRCQPRGKEGLGMSYAPKIILQLPISNPDLLPPFVEACIRDGVSLIAFVGDGCREMEDLIDELIVGDGSDESRFIATSSHPSETVEEVMEIVSLWEAGQSQAVELVKL
jgi:hypothetical protein